VIETTSKIFMLSLLLLFAPSYVFSKIDDCKSELVPLGVKITKEQERKDKSRPKHSSATILMEFCTIPAASGVTIGSDKDRPDGKTIVKNFSEYQISRHAVTQLEYYTVMHERPWLYKNRYSLNVSVGDNYPAVYVSYDDAEIFVERQSLLDKTATWRLPTDAEWERAARGDTSTDYWFGDTFNHDYIFCEEHNISFSSAHEVNSCPNPGKIKDCTNPFGLYILGNVWE
jgi:formylglycine-generating enzyme